MSYIPDTLSSQYGSGSIGSPVGVNHVITPAIYPHPVPNYTAIGMPIHSDYSYFYPLWITMRDTYTGEAAVKAKTTIYLAKLDKMTDREYAAYLRRTPFYNAIKRTHQGLMGSVYRKPPTISIPDNIKAQSKINLESVTRDGQSFTSLLKAMLGEQLLTGRYGVLVDLPDEPGGRPFAATYNPETILNWRTRMIAGREVMDQVLLLETDTILTKIGVANVMQFRLLMLEEQPGGNLIYKQQVTRITDAAEATRDQIGGRDFVEFTPTIRGRPLTYIPFVFVGAISNTTECDYPPLLDIATMNLSHYQSSAELEHGRYFAACPTYVICGDNFNDPNGMGQATSPFTVGPNNLWLLNKDDKASILEFNGHGLTYLENALDQKQALMASLGGKLISQSRRSAAISSNAWDLLASGDEATLLDISQRADEAATKILRYLIEFSGVVMTEKEIAETFVELNKEFGPTELTAREVRALQSLWETRSIPRQVFYESLKSVGVIPPTMDFAEFQALMKIEENLAPKPPEPKVGK